MNVFSMFKKLEERLNMLTRDVCKFLEDASAICKDENGYVKDEKHTDGYIGGYIRL